MVTRDIYSTATKEHYHGIWLPGNLLLVLNIVRLLGTNAFTRHGSEKSWKKRKIHGQRSSKTQSGAALLEGVLLLSVIVIIVL